jgi:hypothetical protein
MMKSSHLKPLVGICVGFAIGWSFSMSKVTDDLGAGGPDEKSSNNRAALMETNGENPRLRIFDGAVWVPKDALESIARETLAARMHMDDPEADGWPCVNALSSWVPMTDDERSQFKKALQQAARRRREWERANVKVQETGPGEWKVFFPGDKGEARLELKRSIEAVFGVERAEQIDILGNTDGFFGMKWLAPGFRHGEIRVRAMTVKSFPTGERIRLSVEIDGRSIGMYLDGSSLEEQAFAGRILKYMGGAEVIRRGAQAR